MARRGEEEEVDVGGIVISPREVAFIVAIVVLLILFRGNVATIIANLQQSLGKPASGFKTAPAQPVAGKGATGQSALSVASVVGGEQAGGAYDGGGVGGDGVGSARNPAANHEEAPYQRRVSDFSGGTAATVPVVLPGPRGNQDDLAARILAGVSTGMPTF